jgi:hypothetical protein
MFSAQYTAQLCLCELPPRHQVTKKTEFEQEFAEESEMQMRASSPLTLFPPVQVLFVVNCLSWCRGVLVVKHPLLIGSLAWHPTVLAFALPRP